MNKMQKDYDHLLNIDYDAPYQIPLSKAESMIFVTNRSQEKLDGRWSFSVDVYDTFLRKKFFSAEMQDDQGRDRPVDCDFDGWEKVMLPSCWNLENEKYYYYEGSCVYTRTFDYQTRNEDERTFLRIGAANYECRVWLNGEQLSRHQGGFTPFFTELTGKLKDKNRIVLLVNNTRKLEQIPSTNYDWFNYGGIFRSTALYHLPKIFIKNFKAALVPNGKFDAIDVEVTLSEAKAGVPCNVEIPELDVQQELYTDEKGVAKGIIPAKPHLWSCSTPKLYSINVITTTDRVSDDIGFREIKVDGKKFLLNGQEIFLKGVCCHEESVTGGRVLSDTERLQMLHTAKEMGSNIMRLTHYPHSERMAQLADKLGILLWEEIPVYWAMCFENEATYQDAANQMEEMIVRDYNRASVIIWSVGNENPDSDSRLSFMSKLVTLSRRLDNTRLISASCLVDIDEMCVKDRLAAHVDVVAFNEYYGWYYRDYEGLAKILENTSLSKPLVISETGAGALPGHFGGDEELFTEEHQVKMYQKQFALSDGKIQGIFPWVLYDFRSPIRLNTMQNQHNRKGLIAFDKEYRKLAFETIKDYYTSKK